MCKYPCCIVLCLLAPIAMSAAQRPDIASPLPRTHPPRPTVAAITVEDLMTREYIIADDSMEGRDTGKRGGLRSAEYIARELKRLGLEPAGNAGSFFQTVPWMVRAPD